MKQIRKDSSVLAANGERKRTMFWAEGEFEGMHAFLVPRRVQRGARVAVVCLAVLASSCTDPAVRKQQFVESGDRYLSQNKLAEAIIQYRNAVQIDATAGDIRKKLAESYAKSGDAQHALEQYVRAADLLPNDIDVQLTAGTYLLLARRWGDSLARADAALSMKPDNVQAHLLRGNALAGLSSFDEALKSIEEAIRLNPTQGNTFTNLGLVQFARGQRYEAEAAFKKAVELSPTSVDARLALGNYYWSIGKASETAGAFRAALQVAPDNGTANRAMAAFAIATGRFADAEPYLQRLADSSDNPRATFSLTDYYLASGRASEAITRLEALRATGQDAPEVGQRLARAYAAAGDSGRAKTLVEQVLARDPTFVDARLLKGQLLLNEGRRDDALMAVKSAATANPSSADAQFALGRMYLALGDVGAAEAAFQQVLRINPRASAAQVEIARLQLASGKVQESVRTADEAAKAQPRNTAARLTLVRGLLASKDLARADREISALLKDASTVSDVHVQAGFLAILKDDVAGARKAFEHAQSLNPQSIDAFAGLLAVDFKTNDLTRLKARLESRLAKEPSPALLMLAARTYWAIQDPASAERSLRAAIEADPANLQPYGMLGQLYVSQRKLEQARLEFETLASRQVKPVGALTMVGMIYQAQGNAAAAKAKFEEVLAIDARAPVAANNLAWMYAEEGGDLDVALKLAQTAAAAAPDVPELMDTLGWVYYKKDMAHLAVPLFERSTEKAPSNASYHYHLGLALLKTGEISKGRASLRRALDSNPSQATAADIQRALDAVIP